MARDVLSPDDNRLLRALAEELRETPDMSRFYYPQLHLQTRLILELHVMEHRRRKAKEADNDPF